MVSETKSQIKEQSVPQRERLYGSCKLFSKGSLMQESKDYEISVEFCESLLFIKGVEHPYKDEAITAPSKRDVQYFLSLMCGLLEILL